MRRSENDLVYMFVELFVCLYILFKVKIASGFYFVPDNNVAIEPMTLNHPHLQGLGQVVFPSVIGWYYTH